MSATTGTSPAGAQRSAPALPVARASSSAQAAAEAVTRWGDSRPAGRWLVAALAVVSLGVLTAGIATPWPWSDEGATYLALQRTWAQLAVLFRSRDAPIVPYYYLARGWTAGVQALWPGTPTLVAVRLLSAFAATGTVLALYALVARNAGRLRGLLAGVVLLAIPGFDRYAQEARTYALLALAATLSWLVADRNLRPDLIPTLFGSAPSPGSEDLGRAATPVGVAVHGLSLAATAAIHSFGVFQWPAHAVAAAIAPKEGGSERARRLVRVGAALAIAALLATAQLVVSLARGTGPHGPASGRLVNPWTISAQLVHSIAAAPTPLAAAVVVVLAVVGGFSRLGRRRTFPISLVVWLAVPLALAIGLGTARTNLFRMRYWIALLPPVAALTALGMAAIVATTARMFRGRVVPVLAVAALLGLFSAMTVPNQLAIRSATGHGEDLGPVFAILARTRAELPRATVAISSPTATGMLSAVDPGLLDTNPLRRLDPTVASVYTSPVPARIVTGELAGVHDIVWIHRSAVRSPGAPIGPPHALNRLHLSQVRVEPAGPDWTVFLLQTTR